MISTTCHNSVDLSLPADMESPVAATSVAGGIAHGPSHDLQGATDVMEAQAAQQDDAWLASLINERRDAIELSEAIFQARIQAQRDQEQQRLQDLLRRMLDGLNDTPAADTATTSCS